MVSDGAPSNIRPSPSSPQGWQSTKSADHGEVISMYFLGSWLFMFKLKPDDYEVLLHMPEEYISRQFPQNVLDLRIFS